MITKAPISPTGFCSPLCLPGHWLRCCSYDESEVKG